MGSLEAVSRHRDPLPAIGFLHKDNNLGGYTPKHSPHAASPNPSHSSSNMYTTQSHSYSYAPPTTAPSQPPYLSSSEPRRLVDDEMEKAAGRQSLPSIHEALGNDNHLPYPSSASAPPSQSGHSASQPPPPQHPSSSHLIGRAGAEGPSGPPNPFSNGPASASLMREAAYPAHPTQLQTETSSRTSLPSVNTQDTRVASLQSLSTGRSPTQSSKTPMTSIAGSQNSSACDYTAPPSAGSVASPVGHGHFPPNYSFNPSQPHHHPSAQLPGGPAYHPSHYDNRAYGTGPRMEDVKGGFTSRSHPPQPHSESVKRHLDVYDVETSLNEISEFSNRTLDFSRRYAALAHQTQRGGPVLGSLPTLNEVEEILHLQRRNQDALIRIRTAVVNQEQAMAEQMAQRKAYKPGEDEHMHLYHEDYKGSGGFAGGDNKKRRGKAAPPGRCHSCNRAETPEWRRGPDGARTLCNACGLHYAKLTRKMGANKAAAMGSNLKPKVTHETASPIAR
ncbi:Sexual development transcription factor NsdD-like protein [Penicillium ucsense]|uniref:Sexual development transcription factor NsdD-like protein n=1 Tax=Penicillium ucsense TaxID=2839758 RepID=A0A8J8VZ78_9EURO|nr:Sexual development transcription factor NsdD-like protein [Penicillium ucsense]KAF7733631.1 Sexual development transcription factor NsdD-like protein [Penicillium ucsense]